MVRHQRPRQRGKFGVIAGKTTPRSGRLRAISQGQNGAINVDVRTALQRYLRHHRSAGSSQHTLDAYTRFVGQFAAYLERQHHSGELPAITADDFRGWLEELRTVGMPGSGYGPNVDRTLRTKTLHVKAFLRWCVAEDYLTADPLRRVPLPKADDKAKATLTPEEVERILQATNPRTATGRRDAAIVLLLYSTAIRSAELRGIQVADVDHAGEQITIRRGKGGKFRIVPLSGKVERSIDRYLNHPKRQRQGLGGALFLTTAGAAMQQSTIRKLLDRLAAKAGVHCNPHKWRHSSAVQYLRGGGRLEVLQKLLGHTALTMTLHYARMAGVDVKRGHETADPTNGIKYRP